MINSTRHKTAQKLQKALQDGPPATLERLAADLLGRLLKVRLSVSKAGFQHGGDVGSAGRAGRFMRVECKRYADTTPLADRELLGEIDQALERDPALEVWVLVATREVSDTTRAALERKSLAIGLPVIVLDWQTTTGMLPDLAALCGWAPDLVRSRYGVPAATAARRLGPSTVEAVERLRHEFSIWRIGYKGLRRAASEPLRRVWGDSTESQALFGQDLAGGASAHLVTRTKALDSISSWWASQGVPVCVVHGAEGMGKSWAAIDWVIRLLGRLPVTLAMPASACIDLRSPTESSVLQLLARKLHEINRTQDETFWRRRLDRMLQAPTSQGPQLLVLIDGLNQEPLVDWFRIVQVLQGGVFRDRVRLIMTTQSNFLERHLEGIRRAGPMVTLVAVGPYDMAPASELDQLFSSHGRSRESFSPELLQLARVPRLFTLVMKLGPGAKVDGDATQTRLLWAYGMDEHGLRVGRAMDALSWQHWIERLAGSLLADIKSGKNPLGSPRHFGLDELEELIVLHSLGPEINSRRLQEICAGTWMEPAPGGLGRLRPREEFVHLALGASLVRTLESSEQQGPTAVEDALAQWLDPIGATSGSADVLAAALSIVVAKSLPSTSPVATALVDSLLRSQNIQDKHRRQIVALAPAVVRAVLDAAERANTRAFASARQSALIALRSIPSMNVHAWGVITERLVTWVAHARCPRLDLRAPATEGVLTRPDAERLVRRIGTSEEGVRQVLGVPIRLQDWQETDLADAVPSVLFGKPLASAARVFAAAAVTAAIGMPTWWDGLKWLVTLNPVDHADAISRLIALSEGALRATPEPGVHPELPTRVASLLLWMTGEDALEQKALSLRASFEQGFDYAADYLIKPTRSFRAIERRHVHLLWNDDDSALTSRIRAAKTFLPDPTLEASAQFVDLLKATAARTDPGRLDTAASHTREDLDLEELELGLARFAPEAAGQMAARWFASLPARRGDARHWAGLRAPQYGLLASRAAGDAAAAMRREAPVPADVRHEAHIATRLLEVELLEKPLDDQLDALVEAANAHLTLDLLSILRRPQRGVLQRFFQRWTLASGRAVEVALNYIAWNRLPVPATLFRKLVPIVVGGACGLRVLAFISLSQAMPQRLGRVLIDRGWRWTSTENSLEQEHGSTAVLAAAADVPLGHLRGIVAPWCLLSAARQRGFNTEDVDLACDLLDAAVNVCSSRLDRPLVDISIDVAGRQGRSGLVAFQPADTRASDDSSRLQELFDEEAQLRARERAAVSGSEYLDDARKSGAVLATQLFDLRDAQMLLARRPDLIERWLEGSAGPTDGFKQRVNAAGGLFLALCEVLLDAGHASGLTLWHAMDECLHIRFRGLAGIDDLKHLPFRVRENSAVLQLRDELYVLHRNLTDASYLDMVICATSNGRRDWLERKVAIDRSSSLTWRGKRAVFIAGLIAEGSIEHAVWPEALAIGTFGAMRHRACFWTNDAVFSRHWWRAFMVARTPAEVYGAWRMFVLAADHRSLEWLGSDTDLYDRNDEFNNRKRLHAWLNWHEVEAAAKRKTSRGARSMDSQLFAWESAERWLEPSQLMSLEQCRADGE